ncbi:hypothetical protein ACFFUP_16190 [Vibrio ostreicida]|uniref:Uncharacterized protein n=1 Tax=Vibrio ostreicida TaxID=526588 RepID=A0ABT8BNY8_9VIBR|nr:hypothetical protein [Vibrio ostreicida]MDN3608596.1 hypothetical protein [Vibrio ostreicida]NPD10991.1 hypothetical protein [Vibrio ostreicida]
MTALFDYAALVTLGEADVSKAVFSTRVILGDSFFVVVVVTKPLRRRIALRLVREHLTAAGRID